MDEQCRCMQVGKMRGTQLAGLVRRMQRIGKQQEPVGEARCFRGQHAGLATAVGMPAEPDVFGILSADFEDLLAQTFAIARGVGGAGRTVRAVLSKWQIITDHFNAAFRESVCDGDQQRRVAIRSSAVSEKEILHVK